jgi:predicted ATP-grasp superfamily ATP-dependent carboligase
VLDKHQTYAAARSVGLSVPRTEQVTSLAEAAALCPSLSFPVVLKWSDPAAVVAQLTLAGLALHKAHYCHSAAELLAYLTPYQQAGVFPLIQQYCAGYGLGQFILMHGGRAHYLFQHRRLHEWPPEGGVSSLSVSLPSTLHRTLMAQSVALLQALDWDGIAMVEYRHDAVTGSSALMEINGRYWGSLPLACHAGASFPWFSYQLLTVGQAGARPDYRAGVRCRFMVPETKRLLRLLFDQRAIADRRLRFARLPALGAWLFDFVRPGTVYQVFRWSDPLPFVRDALQMLRRPWRR